MEIVTAVYRTTTGNLMKTKASDREPIDVESKPGYRIGGACLSRQDAVYIHEPHSDDYIIVDRRGLLSLISKVSIINGVIADVCAIVYNGTQLTLEPVASQSYINAQLEHDIRVAQLENIFKAKDVNVLDLISVVRGKVIKDYIYCGEQNMIVGNCMKANESGGRVLNTDRYRHRIYRLDIKKYVFYKINEGRQNEILFLTSFPKVVENKGKVDLYISESALVENLNYLLAESLIPSFTVDGIRTPIQLFKSQVVDFNKTLFKEWTNVRGGGYNYPLAIHPTGGFDYISKKYIDNLNEEVSYSVITEGRY